MRTPVKVLDKRRNRNTGALEYYLKWEGLHDSENSWELAENLVCVELIADFEERKRETKKKMEAEKRALQSPRDLACVASSSSAAKEKMQKLEPEKILAATEYKGELMFLMKWNGKDEADLISSRQANILCPQLVIAYYEQHLVFDNPSKY